MLPVIASFESRRRSERVRVAMREIKEGRRRTRTGRPPGRPVRATPEKVSAIVRLKAQGPSWKVIGQRVDLPRGTMLQRRFPGTPGAVRKLSGYERVGWASDRPGRYVRCPLTEGARDRWRTGRGAREAS